MSEARCNTRYYPGLRNKAPCRKDGDATENIDREAACGPNALTEFFGSP